MRSLEATSFLQYKIKKYSILKTRPVNVIRGKGKCSIEFLLLISETDNHTV